MVIAIFCTFFFFNDTATTEIYTLSLHDALPISIADCCGSAIRRMIAEGAQRNAADLRSEEHTSELQSHLNLVCRLLLEKKKKKRDIISPLIDSSSSTTCLVPAEISNSTETGGIA